MGGQGKYKTQLAPTAHPPKPPHTHANDTGGSPGIRVGGGGGGGSRGGGPHTQGTTRRGPSSNTVSPAATKDGRTSAKYLRPGWPRRAMRAEWEKEWAPAGAGTTDPGTAAEAPWAVQPPLAAAPDTLEGLLPPEIGVEPRPRTPAPEVDRGAAAVTRPPRGHPTGVLRALDAHSRPLARPKGPAPRVSSSRDIVGGGGRGEGVCEEGEEAAGEEGCGCEGGEGGAQQAVRAVDLLAVEVEGEGGEGDGGDGGRRHKGAADQRRPKVALFTRTKNKQEDASA